MESSVWASVRRSGPVMVVAAVSAIIALISLTAPVLSIRTDSIRPDFPTGDWFVADLGQALPGALFTILMAMVVGVIAIVNDRHWGHGLLTGAGLALIGWSMLVLGLVQIPVDEVYDALAIPVDEAYSVTVIRRVGYALVVVDVIAGLAMVALSITHLLRRGSVALDPWVAAIGAVGIVIAVVGEVLAFGGSSSGDEWGGQAPTLYLIGRGLQLLLLAVGGVVGFLLVSRIGLALVIGSMSASVWLTLTALVGDDRVEPIGTAGRPGADDPPLVTALGVGVALGAVVVALVVAHRRAGDIPAD